MKFRMISKLLCLQTHNNQSACVKHSMFNPLSVKDVWAYAISRQSNFWSSAKPLNIQLVLLRKCQTAWIRNAEFLNVSSGSTLIAYSTTAASRYKGLHTYNYLSVCVKRYMFNALYINDVCAYAIPRPLNFWSSGSPLNL